METGIANSGNRKVQRIDPRMLTGEPTYLFNIYGNEYTRDLGTWGIWYIPPCPEGKAFIRGPKEVPGTIVDTYPHFTDSEEFRSVAVPGEDAVKAILGLDNPMDNISNYGIFASKNLKPTAEELSAAKKKLIPELQRLLAQADKFLASPDPIERQSVYDTKYFRAARFLNVKKPWLSEAAEMTVCPFCTVAVSPQASICSGCHQVINKTAFDAMQKQIAGAA